jgi:hypothetical protein
MVALCQSQCAGPTVLYTVVTGSTSPTRSTQTPGDGPASAFEPQEARDISAATPRIRHGAATGVCRFAAFTLL